MMTFYSVLLLLFVCTSVVLAEENYDFFTVNLQTDSNSRYIIPADMGPVGAAQRFDFALSMGTPYLSVVGASCATCNGSSAYNQAKSTTAKALSGSANFTLIGGGFASGGLITEDCTLPSDNGSFWSYPNQTVVVATNSSYLFNGRVSGIFGLQAGDRNHSSFHASVIGGIFGKYTTMTSFTYGMALLPPSVGSPDAGKLHWFASNTESFVGTVTMKNVTSIASPATISGSGDSQTSVFELDGWDLAIVGGNTIQSSSKNLQASLDPYYPAIYFPADQAKLIYTAINGASSSFGDNSQSTIWTILCGTQFSLSATIGGRSFSLDQSQLIQKNSDGTCSSYIRGWTDATVELYLFGSSFISSLYLIVEVANSTTGQPDQVGFATRTASSPPPKPIGAIVGGTVGGIAVVVIIVVAIFIIIRRNKHSNTFGFDTYVPEAETMVEPFILLPRSQSNETFQPDNTDGLPSPTVNLSLHSPGHVH